MFYLAAGLSFFVLILGVFSIDADLPSTEVDKRVDWVGAGLVTTGLVLIVFVLSDGEIVGWKTGCACPSLPNTLPACSKADRDTRRHHCAPHSRCPRHGPLRRLGTLPRVRAYSHAREGRGGAVDAAAAHEALDLGARKGPLRGRDARRIPQLEQLPELGVLGAGVPAFYPSRWTDADDGQLYYQDYLMLSPILTMVRLLPMFVVGVLCNFAIALCIGRLSLVYIVGASPLSALSISHTHNGAYAVIGTVLTGTASLLFALIDPASPYWAFGFPAAVVSVFGADFVFASGTIFVAKIALPHEQSLAGALFNTMTQVRPPPLSCIMD